MATSENYERLGAWAAILEPDQNIDRRTCHRVVPMQVLSLGAPRTGTLSMCEAYQILGYASPYHYSSIFANAKDADMWIEALEAKYNPRRGRQPFGRQQFDQLLGHCSAVTDVPCIIFWRELLAAYPDAKVVLVERDERKWLDSIEVLVTGVLNPVGRYVLRFTDPGRTGRILNCGMTWLRCWFNVHGRSSVDKIMQNASRTYRSHYDEIRQTVPKDRLLEYRLGSGWEPLCKFLGKGIPKVPFPRRNDAATLELSFSTVLLRAFYRSLINLGSLIVVIVVVFGALRYLMAL